MDFHFAFVLIFAVALTKETGASWLRGKSSSSAEDPFNIETVTSGYRSCPSLQARCWCGKGVDRRRTIINVKQCPYSTPWGSQCEPCVTAKELCHKLDNCARCKQNNPHAVCYHCPPDRHGLLCDKALPCEAPNATEHMTIHPHFTKKGTYKLEFRCTEGRVRYGPKAIKCHAHSQSWNKEPPKCVLPMLCSTMPSSTIPFTRIKQQFASERIVYECDEGYVNTGKVLETILQCDNGVWVQIGESVKCEPRPKCTSLPTFLGARLKASSAVKSVYNSGEQIHYECEDSFQSVPGANTFTLTCVDKQWDGLDPECELKGCPSLTVENGDVSYSGESQNNQSDFLSLNTVAHVTCHDFFTTKSHSEAKCSKTGEWHPSVPRCVSTLCEKKCPVEPVSPDIIAETSETEIRPNETVTYRCKDGTYRVKNKGQVERTCFANGTLSGSEIACKEVPVCKIELSGDSHLRYCRGMNCMNYGGDDSVQEQTMEFPDDVVSMGATVEFSCDSRNSADEHSFYCLEGSPRQMCTPMLGGVIWAPTCKPVCGQRHFQKRALIWGGTVSSINEWPWQAGLIEVHNQQAEFLCGATLIDDEWAVTAAHCVTKTTSNEKLKVDRLKLTYGFSSSNESIQALGRRHYKELFKVEEVIVHENYSHKHLDSDIALVKLARPAEIGNTVGVACLPLSSEDSASRLVDGETGVVTGWGRTETQSLSTRIREMTLTVVNTSNCEEHYEKQGYNRVVVTDNMFCTKSNSTMQDTTEGDSGGPFVMQDSNSDWVLEGIVSWGAPEEGTQQMPNRRSHVRLSQHTSRLTACNGPNCGSEPLRSLPTNQSLASSTSLFCKGSACFGGYTRVGNYVDWIVEKTGISLERCPVRPSK